IGHILQETPSLILPPEILHDIHQWTESHSSRMIWIQGPDSSTYASTLSLTAMHLYTSNIMAGHACISFFCKPIPPSSQPAIVVPENIVVSLLYSTIAQLADHLPVRFPAVPELAAQRFELLDGSFGSAMIAVRMIEALLVYVAPRELVWVFDGLQVAENQRTIPVLRRLVEALRVQEGRSRSKVCFTTDGSSHVLVRAV
ncbi:hypothetical protein BO78DRAFT_275985, partial [Aspergillus sclerotiicarbonarius CBS 121057]